MAAIMTKQGNLDNIVTYEHICDTFEDIQTIDPHYITLGSTCVVINGESGGLEVYMANSEKEWVSLSIASEEGSSSLGIQILGSNDYDSETGVPTIEEPIENVFYLVPNNNDTNDLYEEWIYTNGNWEKFGSGGAVTTIVNADWTAISSEDGYINNKPAIISGSGYKSIEENDHTHSTHSNTHLSSYVDGAIGDNSHAEGYNTAAIGRESHAEGSLTVAKGETTHAEGYKTIAIGNYSHAEGYDTAAIGSRSHTEGTSTMATANAAHAEGENTQATSLNSHAEGKNTQALNYQAHAEGRQTKAAGNDSHAEGFDTTASGSYSHAEGTETQAIGSAAHAEGMGASGKGAIGRASHVEGYWTYASGDYGHAEGSNTIAGGINSHAEGSGTIANGSAQHTFGTYNITDNISIEIVGNGSDDNNRSNARTLDWSGNQWLAGNLTLNQTTLTENDIKKLQSIESGAQVNTVTGVRGNSETEYRTGNINITKDNIGLGNVNNTSDLNKPVSLLQQQAIDAVATKTVEITNTDVIITGVANTRYICGTLSTLDFTPPAEGIVDIIFTSGSSKTILTLPSTVKLPDWFEVEANMTYEISIMDGVYGVVTSWAV